MDPNLLSKVKRCRCNFNPDFPGLHGPNCPAADRPRAAAVPGDGLEPPEDRGTHYRVWQDRHLGHSFSPFPSADRVYTVSVPIGWSLGQHEYLGVVFRSVGRPDARMTAEETLEHAAAGHDGFRVVGRQDRLPAGETKAKEPALTDPCNSPALAFKSADYPVRFGGRVPKRVFVKRLVRGDLPGLGATTATTLLPDQVVRVSVNSHGAVSAIIYGQLLGLKPDEFEVVEWHLVPREDSLVQPAGAVR